MGGAELFKITICANINDPIVTIYVFKTVICSFMEFKLFAHGQVVAVGVALSVSGALSWEVSVLLLLSSVDFLAFLP